jgi:hypothetical protein
VQAAAEREGLATEALNLIYKNSLWDDLLALVYSDDPGVVDKVRKTPSWPRSWANFSLF